MSATDRLNAEQRRAVLHGDGPMLIIAGAGSGKTRVLTARIAELLRRGVPPESILALTFTRKAAEEMRSRVAATAGETARRLTMGTFHSAFARFLRRRSGAIGFPPSFTIWDEDDSQACLKDVIGDTVIGPGWNDRTAVRALPERERKERKALLSAYAVRDVASRISRLKNMYATPDTYLSDRDLMEEDAMRGRPLLGAIYREYMIRCRRAAAMDYDDILMYTLRLLTTDKEALDALSGRYRHILVDEFQDTNRVQYAIVKLLASRWGNLCCVGDDSQSIYAFRGADIGNILGLREDFPGLATFRLDANYRSTPEIVGAANRLIAYNTGRIPKECRSMRPSGAAVETHSPADDREEAFQVASDIMANHARGLPWSANAVLYRTNAQSRALEDAMLRLRIPYAVRSGTSFFERAEVKDAVAWMRLAVNPRDDAALRRAANKPARGIGDTAMDTLVAKAAEERTTLWATMREASSDSSTRKPLREALTGLLDLVTRLSTDAAALDATSAAELALERSGILGMYAEDPDEDTRKRADNIRELLNGIRYFTEERMGSLPGEGESEAQRHRCTLCDWLEDMTLASAVDGPDPGDAVTLMTSHCSKGLEFPTVYVTGVEEGLFPALRDGGTPSDVEEERRLLYVSMTRAKDRLVLTHCGQRWRYGKRMTCEPSRFLAEMGGGHVDQK